MLYKKENYETYFGIVNTLQSMDRNAIYDEILEEEEGNLRSSILIIKDNLTEDEAHDIECWLINKLVFEYGYSINIPNNRSDEKGMHLVNCTWGGEGTSGCNPFENKTEEEIKEWKERIGKANSGKMESLVAGLGGKDNISTVENCFTRLRVNVKNPELLDEKLINVVPNSGIGKKDNDIQIIIGLTVADVRKELEDYLENK